jgi:hypothetical protein
MSKPTLTRNINSLLKEFAQDNLITLDECDFKLIGTVTYIKYPQSESYVKMPDDLISNYSKHIDNVIRDNVNINQVYKIELLKSVQPLLKLDYVLRFDELNTHPKLVIFPSSLIPYMMMKPIELFKHLVMEVNKIKARNRILTNFHNNEMLEDLKKFVRHIYAGKFEKPVRILLFEGVEPKLSSQGQLNLFFQRKNSRDHQLIEVEEKELIFEYKKPVYGSNGFNCYGKQIEKGLLESKALELKVDEHSIETLDYGDKLQFFSKKKGFVDYDKNEISVNNIYKSTNISRNHSQITDTENNSIEVYVAQNDSTRDSIGEGVKLVSERIHVSGHTGAKSILEATDVIIEGATHKESSIYSRYVDINRHKGMVRCNKAKIALLEGGVVHASHVEIDTCLGGTIYAKDVVIDHVKNKLVVYASNSITIRLVSGEDNSFVIDHTQIPVIISELALIESDLDDLKFEIEEDKKKGGNNLQELETKVKTLKDQKAHFANSSYTATVDILNSFTGLNTIKFVLKNNNELIYKTKAQKYSTFHLETDGDRVTLHPVELTKQI